MNVVICGINGAMGKVLKEEAKTYSDINIIGSISTRNNMLGDDILEKTDVVIDFSNHSNINYLIDYSKKHKCALLVCTTGFSDEEKIMIEEAGKHIPILLSSNTSLGANIMRKIVKIISKELNSFDIDIIEKHHNKKKDAPSGTAKTLAEDIKQVTGRTFINTAAVRAGTIPGEHTVMYSGTDEILEIKHTALSKKIFARGAFEIALKLINKPVGYYTTEDLF